MGKVPRAFKWLSAKLRRCEAGIRRHAIAIQAISAIVIASFTVALFFVGKWQWNAMQDTLKRTDESNRLTRQAMKLNSRAWLIVKDIETDTFVVGKPVKLTVHVNNYGHIPAFMIAFRIAYVLAKPPFPTPRPQNFARTVWASGVVGPGQPYPVHDLAAGIPPPDIGRVIETGEAGWYVYFQMAYRDDFGRHKTKICGRYVGPNEAVHTPASFTFCPKYNDAT